MSADTITSPAPDPSGAPQGVTGSDSLGGGAGRGGGQNGSRAPLVVVQQGRGAAPPRPAPAPSPGSADTSLRNGYAAISHSVSGQASAIGLGFLLGGPVGAVIGGAVAPAALAALMWRSRSREHDGNSNDTGSSSGSGDRSGARGTANQGGGRGGGAGRGNAGGAAAGRRQTPNGSGADARRKPKPKDPVADKLGKIGKDLGRKLKNRGDKTPDGKHPRRGKDDKAAKDLKGTGRDKAADPKTSKDDGRAKGLKDGLRDGLKIKDRGKQPGSDRPWRGRGGKDKPEKPGKDKHRKDGKGGDVAATARDGIDPKKPSGGGTSDDIVDAEIVDDGVDPHLKKINNRIGLVRAKRERAKRRQAVTEGKRAADKAARDGDCGDPDMTKFEVIRERNRHIDQEIRLDNERLALAAAAENPRSTPVNYPAIQAAPVGTSTPGVAIARQVDFRASQAYAILRTLADQLANGFHNDDADMGDHIVELTGIPNMCKSLSVAVQEAARALARTAPLHPTVIKHLNNAAVMARSAGVMADNIMVVFVQAHREDIIRVLDPRIGEERWNLRNGPGTLDAAKLRAAIASAHSARLALPAGTSGGGSGGGSKLVPVSDAHTRKLVQLMKGFDKGHMTVVLSEVAGAAAGVEIVADSVTKLYRRMVRSWPTEGVVDDTVRATASKVGSVADELRKAIKAAQRAHQRELKLNAKPRKGARAESKWDVVNHRGSAR